MLVLNLEEKPKLHRPLDAGLLAKRKNERERECRSGSKEDHVWQHEEVCSSVLDQLILDCSSPVSPLNTFLLKMMVVAITLMMMIVVMW